MSHCACTSAADDSELLFCDTFYVCNKNYKLISYMLSTLQILNDIVLITTCIALFLLSFSVISVIDICFSKQTLRLVL